MDVLLDATVPVPIIINAGDTTSEATVSVDAAVEAPPTFLLHVMVMQLLLLVLMDSVVRDISVPPKTIAADANPELLLDLVLMDTVLQDMLVTLTITAALSEARLPSMSALVDSVLQAMLVEPETSATP